MDEDKVIQLASEIVDKLCVAFGFRANASQASVNNELAEGCTRLIANAIMVIVNNEETLQAVDNLAISLERGLNNIAEAIVRHANETSVR